MESVVDSDFAERYLKRVQEIIERSGWVVQYVAGTPDDPVSFAYTIGLKSTLGHRELFIVGFEQQMSLDILNAAGNAIRDGARLDRKCQHLKPSHSCESCIPS